MRLTFLGTGTSAGVPAIACDCDVCRSEDPRDKRLRTSAALQFTDSGGMERTILIDASPDLRQQALRANLTRLDAILFTHNHVDHTFGLDEVRRFNAVMHIPIDIYAEPHTLQFLRRVYAHIFEAKSNVNESFVATLIAHPIEPGQVLDLFGARIEPIRLLHGRLRILGYRIEGRGDAFPLAYCTDVSGVPPESWAKLEGLSTLVLDALRHRRHPTHLTLEQAVSIADQVGATHTYFVHMSHDLGHAVTNASLPERMSLAYDGLVIG